VAAAAPWCSSFLDRVEEGHMTVPRLLVDEIDIRAKPVNPTRHKAGSTE
jgi:hypothetical protein